MNYYPLWHCLDDKSREALKPFLPKDWYEPSNTIGKQKPIAVADDSSEEYEREMKKKPGRD